MTVRGASSWGAAALGTAAAGAAAAVASAAGSGQAAGRIADVAVVAACSVSGALVLEARPGHRVGRLLLGGGALWGGGSLLLELAVAGLAADPADRRLALVAVAALTVRGLGFLLLVVPLPLYFPDGRLPSARWRPAQWPALAAGAGFLATTLLVGPAVDERLAGVAHPLGLPPGGIADVVGGATIVAVLLAVAVGLAAVGTRWWRGDALLRQQVGWFTGATALAAGVGAVIVATGGAAILFPLAAAALPVAVGVAVLQHRLYDVDVVLNRALVYGALTAVVVALYLLVVTGVGAMVGAAGADWLGLLAAGVVAVAFQPLRDALQRAVNRLTYGAWDEPYAVLARLARSLDGGTPVLAEAVAATRDALRLDALEVRDAHGRVVAGSGTAGAVRELPLVLDGTRVGTLRVSGGRRRPRPRDERLLADLAGQLAPVVSALQLTGELQRSRQRLVTAREEERRRLRRELHDGVGSALAGLTLELDTARRTARADPAVQDVLLGLRGRAGEVVADVRRAVEDLRPPALDELGLAGVLAELVQRLRGPGLRIDLSAPDGLPALPAAVEVAAYRIAQEALTNVVRHSGARHCEVALDAEPGRLRLRVADDGRGTDGRPAGTGLGTMRERAEELGGTLTHGPGRPAGTVVEAVLPVAPA